MFSRLRSLENHESSKRDVSFWHLCAIYGLLTLCVAMGMLSLVWLQHLNRRQMDVEVRLGMHFDTRQSVGGKARKPAHDGNSQSDDSYAEDVTVLEALPASSFADSEYTDESEYTNAASNRTFEVPESGNKSGVILEAAWHRGRRNADPSNSVLSWGSSEADARGHNSVHLSSEHQSSDEKLSSVLKGLSGNRESPTSDPMSRSRRRLSREARNREGDSETISVREQPGSNRNRKTPKNRTRSQQQKLKNESGFQGMAAIHLQAPDHMHRQYESGPTVSLNASHTKDTVYRFWRKASWVRDDVADVFHLDEETGHVTVEIEGVYMIYAQVVYHDLSGRWSFGIYVGDRERVKCLATEQLRDLQSYHPTSHGVYQSCYTSIVLHIRKNQSVSIRCMYGSRTILTRPEFTFWGMVRLS